MLPDGDESIKRQDSTPASPVSARLWSAQIQNPAQARGQAFRHPLKAEVVRMPSIHKAIGPGRTEQLGAHNDSEVFFSKMAHAGLSHENESEE
jgi:hypothetical protein